MTLEQRCQSLLESLGLIQDTSSMTVESLTGGVASDIAKVTAEDKTYCVKFALPKLRVAADWFAPVERNYAEYCWLKTMAAIAPEASLKLYGHSREDHGFVMEYLSGEHTYLYKNALLEGHGKDHDAHAVGTMLGCVHKASTEAHFDPSPFQNFDDFFALRIEPYLTYTADNYPNLYAQIHQMASALYNSKDVLVHGDVSPKNIMFKDNVPYILDAECATMGDAAFDLAFCMNHFILKAIHLPEKRHRYLSFCQTFWNAYAPSISWEDPSALNARLSQLLPMLMLARVDGKSPVEYLTDASRQVVRDISIPIIAAPKDTLAATLKYIEESLTS